MRYIPLLIVCLLLVAGSCKSKKEISGPEQRKRVHDFRTKRRTDRSIVGFWQEYKRTIHKKRMAETPLEFNDTLKVVFREDSTTRFYDLHSRISGGRFAYKHGLYHLGNGQSFSTIKRLGDTLKLGKDNRYSYLRKVPGFYTVPVALERTDIIDVAENDELDKLFLQGEWKVYKKEGRNYSNAKVYLYSMKISDKLDANSYSVKMYYSRGSKTYPSKGSIAVSNSELRFETSDYKRTFTIITAKGAELILEQGEVVYYLKNLSK